MTFNIKPFNPQQFNHQQGVFMRHFRISPFNPQQFNHQQGVFMRHFRINLIAVAIGAAFALPAAADSGDIVSTTTDNRASNTSVSVSETAYIERMSVNTSDRSSTQNRSTTTSNTFSAAGSLVSDSRSESLLDAKQISYLNMGTNTSMVNRAAIDGSAFSSARGNVGVNVAAGDGNQQINSAALAVVDDMMFVFGTSAADVASYQDSSENNVLNTGVTNRSLIGGSAFSGAVGNIAVSMAAGSNNQQKNSISMAVSNMGLAEANVAAIQKSNRNVVSSDPRAEFDDVTGSLVIRDLNANKSMINGSAFAGVAGNIGVNMASGTGNQQLNALSLSISSSALRAQQ
jgi:hypothetical protein